MHRLKLTVLSLRYSSWSMRAWLALTHTGARFVTDTVEPSDLPTLGNHDKTSGKITNVTSTTLSSRRALGSVHGLFPVLWVDDTPIHESLAICEYVADTHPDAGLWPANALSRAQARAVSSEMVSGFVSMRAELSSHLFGRVPDFVPSTAAGLDIARIFELWDDCLSRSGGPFLFGDFSIADAMFFPVLGRFRTYGIPLKGSAVGYAQALETLPAGQKLIELARNEPRIPDYDAYIRDLGGDPDGALLKS